MSDDFRNVRPSPGHEPSLYREIGGLDRLRILDEPAVTAGMVVVGRDGEDYERRPELKWQAWPDRLEPMVEGSSAAQ